MQGRETLLPGLPEIHLGILYLRTVWEVRSRTEGVLNSGGRGGVRGPERQRWQGHDNNEHPPLTKLVPGARCSSKHFYSLFFYS